MKNSMDRLRDAAAERGFPDCALYEEAAAEIERLLAVVMSAEACFDTLDPREPSGLSDAETASLFNATREQIRVVLNSYR